MRLKINADSLPGLSSGDEIEVRTKGGVITDKYWRSRLADSKIDNCVSVVDNKVTAQVEVI